VLCSRRSYILLAVIVANAMAAVNCTSDNPGFDAGAMEDVAPNDLDRSDAEAVIADAMAPDADAGVVSCNSQETEAECGMHATCRSKLCTSCGRTFFAGCYAVGVSVTCPQFSCDASPGD